MDNRMTLNSDRRRIAAIHECGHAFMCWNFGGDLDGVFLGDAKAAATFYAIHDNDTVESTYKEIMVSLGGPAAELLYAGDCVLGTSDFYEALHESWMLDAEDVSEDEDTSSAFLREFRKINWKIHEEPKTIRDNLENLGVFVYLAQELLTKFWGKILDAADALLSRGALSKADFETIILASDRQDRPSFGPSLYYPAIGLQHEDDWGAYEEWEESVDNHEFNHLEDHFRAFSMFAREETKPPGTREELAKTTGKEEK